MLELYTLLLVEWLRTQESLLVLMTIKNMNKKIEIKSCYLMCELCIHPYGMQ